MKMRTAVFFILPILLVSCDPVYVAFLSNHSSWPVYFSSEFESKSASSDTCFNFSREDLKLVKPNEREFLWGMMFTKLDEYMAEIGARQVRVYIFHPDTLAKYSWEEIKAGHKVLQRYDLTRRDLQQLDEEYPEVPFPPDGTIRNARMFPPYGTYSKRE